MRQLPALTIAAALALGAGCERDAPPGSATPTASAVIDPQSCERPCRSRGRCAVRDGECVAVRPEHCARSSRCKMMGWCDLVEGPCDLGGSGRCRDCRVGRDESCKSARRCKAAGACTALLPSADRPWGKCVPGSDADCQQSLGCTRSGRCTREEDAEIGPVCVIAGDEDCRRSEDCKLRNRCERSDNGRRCRLPRDADAGPAASAP